MSPNYEHALMESLRANRIDPKLLYVTPRQAKLWCEVFLKHSPIHTNPEFGRIYGEAFARVAGQTRTREVAVIGLGCGTGAKEARLCAALKSEGTTPAFAAVDISRDLVDEAGKNVAAAGAAQQASLVCDLSESAYLRDWLERAPFGNLPRILTLFGLVPNLMPSAVIHLIRAIVRPTDVLLVSAHLAPIDDETLLPDAMRRVLPQYDNAETRAWLAAGVEEWGLSNRVAAPRVEVSEVEGMPAFVARAKWKTAEPIGQDGLEIRPNLAEPLRVFYSLRYTPKLFEEVLTGAGFSVELLALTACREEGIWAVRSD